MPRRSQRLAIRNARRAGTLGITYETARRLEPYAAAGRRYVGNQISNLYNRARTWSSGNDRPRQRSRASSAPARGYRPYNSNRSSYKYNKGRRGRRRIVRKRYKKNYKKGGLVSKIWRSLCTPQTIKETISFSRGGIRGQRQWAAVELGGLTALSVMAAKRPSNFLFNTAKGSSSTATIQEYQQKGYKMSVDKFMWDMRIQNRSNACMELKIYDCLVRNDISAVAYDTTITSWAGFFQSDMNIPTFLGTGDLGPGQAALPAGLANNWGHPTFTPYMSGQFVGFFKILKTQSHYMQPNEIMPLNKGLRKKVFDGQKIENVVASSEWQKGWSRLLLFSWVGMPVDDGTLNNQTKAICDLFVQADITMKFHFVPGRGDLTNISYSNDVNGISSTYVINPGTAINEVVPATETVQTVPGYTTNATGQANGGLATDLAPSQHP